MQYDVKADVYEGPLPLLVELTRLNLIDVFLIKLVDLTNQFLVDIKSSGHNINELSEPLPLLGSLIAIKARGLLPKPALEEGEEEVPISMEELERRLKEYEQFKTVAQLLSELRTLAHHRFPRMGKEEEMVADKETVDTDTPLEVSLPDLMSMFSSVLEKAVIPLYEVRAEPWTVEIKVKELRTLLMVKKQVRFSDLFTAEKSKFELVVTFLALLELIRQHVAQALQQQDFGEIMVVARQDAPKAGVEPTLDS